MEQRPGRKPSLRPESRTNSEAESENRAFLNTLVATSLASAKRKTLANSIRADVAPFACTATAAMLKCRRVEFRVKWKHEISDSGAAHSSAAQEGRDFSRFDDRSRPRQPESGEIDFCRPLDLGARSGIS
jgi:hypothetical protein